MIDKIWQVLKRYVEDKNWLLANRWLLTLLPLVVIGVGSWMLYRGGLELWFFFDSLGKDELPSPLRRWADQPVHLGSKLTLIMLTALVGWFLDIFTGEADKRKVNQMVTFCYVFPFAMIAAILLPLFAYPETLPTPPKPIGLVLGCAEPPLEPKDQKLIPDGIRCTNASDQWLVNVGGDARRVSQEERAERQAAADAQRKAEEKARVDAAEKKTKAAEAAKAAAKAKSQDKDPAAADAAKAEEQVKADEKAAAEAKVAIDEEAAIAKSKVDEKLKAEQQARAARTPEKSGTGKCESSCDEEAVKHYVITGGLVVPLYYVILAVFGGFVSMLRRVPEYQERMSAGASEPLTDSRAREKLVFEVLQLLAAPLIALTAYYLIEPASRSSSIALAFIAGFSSETVLLYVRALVEKLQPETSRRTPDIELVPTSLDFKDVAVNTTSPPDAVKLTNRTASILSGTVTATGEFECTPHGPFAVSPGSALSFNVTFKPTSPGDKLGQLEIKDNGPNSPRVVKLTGTGV